MRIKHVAGGLTAATLGLMGALAPAIAQGQSAHRAAGHHITINVQPRPSTAGDPVIIYGRLLGPNNAGRVVNLYHRVALERRFSFVQRARTDARGAYEFPRADGVVTTNRSWFVRALGVRSRAVYEPVMAQVTLNGPPAGSTLLTGPRHPYTFSGTVSPATAGARVLLQRQNATARNDDWHRIDSGRVRADGTFTIVHHFIVPGDANLRVLVLGNRRNAPSPSSPIGYEVSQAQNPRLTINASPNPASEGQTVTVTGVLAGGPNMPVTLYAHTAGNGFQAVAVSSTDATGNYAFSQAPVNSTYYQVRGGRRSSAVLFEGVKDLLTASASATTVQAGQPVTFSGTVSPDKTGHVIYLQRQNASGGDFHSVAVASVGPGSAYAITKRVYASGTFRVLIPGGPENEGAARPGVAITVTPVPASAVTPPAG